MPIIELVISDVDGTLVTPEHVVTERARRAVESLRARGIRFTIASSRPPRGLLSIVETLRLQDPFAAFNGAVIRRPAGETLAIHLLPRAVCETVSHIAGAAGLELWAYSDEAWCVTQRSSFVDREEQTLGFSPMMVSDLGKTFESAAKLVIVGDPALVEKTEPVVIKEVGEYVSATRSKPRYLDITSVEAHKGTVVTQLSEILQLPAERIAVIGDGLNDILMFERAGFSIAMGEAVDEVRNAADVTTAANTEEGFARAIEEYILGGRSSS